MPKEKKKKKSRAPWLSYGDRAFEKEKEFEANRYRQGRGMSQFRQKPGQTSKIVQLDDQIIFLLEHNAKFNNRFVTKICLEGSEDGILCPYCNDDDWRKSGNFIVGTVINLTGFENDNGERIANFKQVLKIKGAAKEEYFHERQRLAKKYGEDSPCELIVWEVRRDTDKKSVSTGSHFRPLKKTSRKRLIELLTKRGVEQDDWDEFLAPVDYVEMTRPETEDEARAFLGLSTGGKKKEEFDDDDDDGSVDDDF